MKPSLSTPPEQIAASSLFASTNLILLFLGLHKKPSFPLPHGLGIFPDRFSRQQPKVLTFEADFGQFKDFD